MGMPPGLLWPMYSSEGKYMSHISTHLFRNQPPLTDLDNLRLGMWNFTRRETPRDTSIPQLVSTQAGTTPDAVAVTQGNLSLTYKELDERASRLAHLLRSFGVGPDVVVALYLNRSLAMVIAALAILK